MLWLGSSVIALVLSIVFSAYKAPWWCVYALVAVYVSFALWTIYRQVELIRNDCHRDYMRRKRNADRQKGTA